MAQQLALYLLFLEEGILSQTRLYVHLSQDKETATKVGSRHGKPYVFTIDTKQMYEDGYEVLSLRKQYLSYKDYTYKILKGFRRRKLFCAILVERV